MNRRAFVTGLGAVLAAPRIVGAHPLIVKARPAAEAVATIARFCCVDLGTATLNAEFRQAFTDGLGDHGWGFLDKYHWADEWSPAQVSVMAFVNAPVASRFVGNVVRFENGSELVWMSLQLPEASGKRIQLLREVAPTVARIAILSDPVVNDPRPAGLSIDLTETEAAARKLGIPVHVIEVPSGAELAQAFAAIAQERATGVIILPSATLYAYRARIARLAMKHHLPTVTSVEAGCLMSYGPDLADLARRAAYIMDKLLWGAKPADLPVDHPTKFKLTINRKTAKVLGLIIPPSLLRRANQVIE